MPIETTEIINTVTIDDDKDFLELEKIFLEKINKNLRIFPFSNPQRALNHIKSEKVDIVVSDYEMPVMTGLDLFNEITSLNLEIPFIILTGKSREEVAIRALNLGVDNYLQKGTNVETLFTELNHMINLANQRRRIFIIQSALDGARDSVWDWNIVTREVTYDDRFRRSLGYEVNEETFDLDWLDENIHPESIHLFDIALKDYINGKTSNFEIEYQLKDKFGSWKWFLARGHSISYDKDGQPLRLIGTQRDITDHIRIENLLKQSEKKIKIQEYELRKFISMLIDDSKNNFTNIKMIIEKLRESGDVEASQNFFELFKKNIIQLEKLIQKQS